MIQGVRFLRYGEKRWHVELIWKTDIGDDMDFTCEFFSEKEAWETAQGIAKKLGVRFIDEP